MEERSCIYYDNHRRQRCTECGLQVAQCQCADTDEAAHRRLWSEDGKMIRAIRGELQAVRDSIPNNHFVHAELIKHVGRLTESLMEHSLDNSVTAAQVFKETILVAAMAIRLGTEGDRDFAYESYEIFPEENTLP